MNRYVKSLLLKMELFRDLQEGRALRGKREAGEFPVFLDYEVRSVPRYGYGRPPHGKLFEILNRNRLEYARTLQRFLEFKDSLQRIPVHKPEDVAMAGGRPYEPVSLDSGGSVANASNACVSNRSHAVLNRDRARGVHEGSARGQACQSCAALITLRRAIRERFPTGPEPLRGCGRLRARRTPQRLVNQSCFPHDSRPLRAALS